MCHDLETSKKFYQADPPPKATAQVRSAILRTMMTGDEEDNDSEGEEDDDSQGKELGEEQGEESGEERAEEEDKDSDEEEEDEDSDASEEEEGIGGIQIIEDTEDESEVEQVVGCKRKARVQIIQDSSEEEEEEERSRKRTRRGLFTVSLSSYFKHTKNVPRDQFKSILLSILHMY